MEWQLWRDSSPSRRNPTRLAFRPIGRPRPRSATSAKRRFETSHQTSVVSGEAQLDRLRQLRGCHRAGAIHLDDDAFWVRGLGLCRLSEDPQGRVGHALIGGFYARAARDCEDELTGRSRLTSELISRHRHRPCKCRRHAAARHAQWSRKRGDILDAMKAEIISNEFVVASGLLGCGVGASKSGFNDTAEAFPVRSSR